MRQRSPESINSPYHHHVKLSTCRSFPKGIEGRPLFPTLGSADGLVNELMNNRPSIPLGHELQLTQLVLSGLAVRAHPSVNGRSFRLVVFDRAPISITLV